MLPLCTSMYLHTGIYIYIYIHIDKRAHFELRLSPSNGDVNLKVIMHPMFGSHGCFPPF